MAVDTPAKIAILGAGPIGLEAALYARFLGYEVEVFEHLTIGGTSGLNRFRERKMSTSFGENSSRLGLQAISTQDPESKLPMPNEILYIGEWFDRYVKPLSTVDLLDGAIRSDVQVLLIGKVELNKIDVPVDEFDRGAWDFRLLFQRLHSSEYEITTADIVLDCSGTQPNFIGHGGLPPAGKPLAAYEFESNLSGADGETVLVVGDHPSAANAILELVELKHRYPDTHITWITPYERTERVRGPFSVPSETLESSQISVLKRANECALNGQVEWRPGTWIDAIHRSPSGGFEVQTSGEHESVQVFDQVIAHNGVRPNWEFTRELQLDICPITDAPRPFSEYLLKRPSPYSVEYPAPNPQALITSEPNYYVLGSKSFGRMPGFLYQHGLRQIRDVFTIIGDRADLDLYAQMK